MRPEFAYQEGISFAELMKRGAVFDLSNVSNNMKQFYYALILNQAYSVLDAYDENGSNDLRTLLVLEEAQLALKSGEYNAAIVDMKQRIQDFRKKGIGLLLITHAATELSRELRRLCQTKLYFRQSADVAKYAIEDLALDKSSENEMLIKTIANRICLANYVKEGSIGMEVLKTNALYLAKEEKKQEEESIARGEEMTVQLLDPNGEPIANKRVQIYYAGEKLADLSTDEQGIARLGNTLPKRRYIVKVLGKKKKETITLTAIGGEKNAFSITQE